MKIVNLNNLTDHVDSLQVREKVLLNGTIFTARDAAHKRLLELIKGAGQLPFNISGSTIYYAGPTATPKGSIIGSCGPTTSGRMDSFTPTLLDNGLACMIGKGQRSDEVVEAIIRNKAIYFCAVGGAGALYAGCVTSLEVIAFEELGCESIKRLTIKDFPVYVGIDSKGNNIYN